MCRLGIQSRGEEMVVWCILELERGPELECWHGYTKEKTEVRNHGKVEVIALSVWEGS